MDIYINGEINSQTTESIYHQLQDVSKNTELTVYIDSVGGSVKDGYAIYNMLSEFKSVTTIGTGCVGSIASVIYMLGQKRLMQPNSYLFIHNPFIEGNIQADANKLSQIAKELDKLSEKSLDIYCTACTLDRATIKQMMDNETFINPQMAMNIGFVTGMIEDDSLAVTQSVKKSIYDRIFKQESTVLKNLRKLL